MGSLYIIGTPIGNLEDITLRALRLLQEVNLIAAEDTRHTGRLLAHYEITTPQISYHEHNKLARLEVILKALETGDVALVSDAGMPGLSDPGYKLVEAAIEHGISVVPVPGPSALTAAVVASGLPSDAFVYLGFLPRRPSDRRRLLAEIAGQQRTLVAYESPRRLLATLEEIEELLGDRRIAVARELTKLHEEIWRGPVSQARQYFDGEVRGEITLVIAGAPEPPPWTQDRVRDQVLQLMAEGLSHREAVKRIAQNSGWARRDVYQLTLNEKKQKRMDITMVDLDAVTKFAAVDRQGMLDHALELPRTCADAWDLAQKHIPQLGLSRAALRAVKRIVITGMGGSAIGGDLLASLVAHECTCPIWVHRDYGLPAFVDGSETLVIGSSYSGGTEETLSAFNAAHERGALLLALTTGGELARLASEWDVPALKFGYEAQPRAALGYSFVLLVSLLNYLGFVSGKATDLTEAVNVMRDWQKEIGPDVPLAQNPAKRLADQLKDRIPVIYGSGITEPVARRWKTQFNENAKSWAFYEPLPELNHNAVVGFERSDLVCDRAWVVTLQSRYDSERIQTRWNVTRQMLSNEDIGNDAVQARGTSRLAQMLSLIHFGDLVSVYRAIANEVDPTPVGPIAYLKRELAKS